MLDLLSELFPLNRSITGDGVRQTLAILKRELPDLRVDEVPSGEQAFDWTVPDEWNCSEAYLLAPDGRRLCDYAEHNLHLVGYSEPTDRELSLSELQPHLHSLPDQPEAIPYVTSYYKRNWGFCLPHSLRETLPDGSYRAVVRSTLEPGSLTYGELHIPANSAEDDGEVLLSTYVCHPSMANNELSGPVVTTALSQWIQSLPARRLSYRVLFLPETIGALVYMSRNLEEMKRRIIAGLILTCLGDEGSFSYVPSRQGDSLADRVALHILRHQAPEFKRYTFLDRGSDERQYCSPGVDLPVATICRSKYHEYPEYHTSLDNLDFVTQKGLDRSLSILKEAILCLEGNRRYRATTLGEPQLGKRGLYPAESTKDTASQVADLTHLLAYADGEHDLLAIAELSNRPLRTLVPLADSLSEAGLLALAT